MLNETAPEPSTGEMATIVFPSSKETFQVGTPEVAGVVATEILIASPRTAAITEGVSAMEVPACLDLGIDGSLCCLHDEARRG
jgi:hypothetical protein